jgi:NAD+ synthase (glutamine-hydrolysing)
MHLQGFLRVTAASTPIAVANPRANRESICKAIRAFGDSDVIVFGELCLSGYTSGELFSQKTLLDSCVSELIALSQSVQTKQLIVVGLPFAVDGKLFNVAAVLCNGNILGLIPKQHLPNYQEFYEARWFQSGAMPIPHEVELSLADSEIGTGSLFRSTMKVPFGTDLLFQCGNAIVGVEVCEDLWVPIPPSSLQAIGGANVLLNLSASNETIGKAHYRKQLIASQSGKCIAAYAYASAGPTESTTDLVFGGHCLIAENGSLLAESKRVGTGLDIAANASKDGVTSFATSDIDLDRIEHDRRVSGSFHQPHEVSFHKSFRRIPFELAYESRPLVRRYDAHPFVPSNAAELDDRCAEIFEIQCAALAKRVSMLPASVPLVIGISGGLDSTLALIVAAKMIDALQWDPRRVVGMTLPGFGTSIQTKTNALQLMDLLGIAKEAIDIRESCLKTYRDLQHAPFGIELDGKTVDSLQLQLEQLPEDKRNDLVFENVQARMRTMLLMNRGFVIGTGDLSESALGWCTYNADHMSMYNVNCSVPKTLVKFLVRYVALNHYDGEVRRVLLDIAETPISPELLPLSKNKQIHQSTEASVGPYELNDFFLYHFVRSGATPEKILLMAEGATFDQAYKPEEIRRVLATFIKRFFAAQFKRSCVPDGPKVGSVSLSPRGDWRMPSDADAAAWLR